MTGDDFEQLVRDHQVMVFRMLARLIDSRDVEDAAQEVFLRLYRALPHFRGQAKLSTYLYRIVINVAQDERARRQRPINRTYSLSDPDERWDERLPQTCAPIDRVLEQQETWDAVQGALAELGDRERAALILYHEEERSYDEIAAILELPVNTVRTHLHRGRRRLAQAVLERLGR
jgi:RNA polymerase sigma-70 factor (ECF subfamily)